MASFGTNASGETSCPNFEPMQIMVAQFATDASGSFWWPNLQSVQVAPPAKICLQMAGGAILWPNLQLFQVVPSDGKTDPVVCTLK